METILGYGDFRYAESPSWGDLPEGMSYREVPDVAVGPDDRVYVFSLSLIHISEPTRLLSISYAVLCLKKKTYNNI